jgi:hypothetical protein
MSQASVRLCPGVLRFAGPCSSRRVLIRRRDQWLCTLAPAKGTFGRSCSHSYCMSSVTARSVFFFGFNLVLFTKRLFLADYLIQYAGFLIATTTALVVGKAVLVADHMSFTRRFDRAPLAYPILFKSVVYTMFVFVARLIEALVHYLIEGGVLGSGRFVSHILGNFSWRHFIAVQLWIFILFLIYVAASELNKLIGDGEFFRILFKRRSSELQSTRRGRIRLLARLVRLIDAHPINVLEDAKSPPHIELVTILRALGHSG